MGVNLKNADIGEIQPQCNDCGICLCWSIDGLEYLKWSEFWDKWTCSVCNPNYKGAYHRYQLENKPFKQLDQILNNNEQRTILEQVIQFLHK